MTKETFHKSLNYENELASMKKYNNELAFMFLLILDYLKYRLHYCRNEFAIQYYKFVKADVEGILSLLPEQEPDAIEYIAKIPYPLSSKLEKYLEVIEEHKNTYKSDNTFQFYQSIMDRLFVIQADITEAERFDVVKPKPLELEDLYGE